MTAPVAAPAGSLQSSDCSVAWMLGAQLWASHADPEWRALRWRDTDFVRKQPASYRKSRHVVFVDLLPRSAGNKGLKHQVAQHVSSELALQ